MLFHKYHAGSWTITVLEHPDMGVLYNQGFSHVLISKDKMSFSGGPKGRKHDVTLSLHRTPEGVIYLDEKGSELTKFDPRNGVIETLSFHGFKCMLKRDGDLAVTNQPCWWKSNNNWNRKLCYKVIFTMQ